ncbi:MAG: DUF3471 domain-containing protein [Chitinophagaceae bacterium]|nr:MAG: DUF3471 domain-containing protein [Chitinophagaceae bacterium]
MKRVVFLVFFLVVAFTAMAQFPAVTIPGSQVRKIQSYIVNQEYELHVLLPANYSEAKKYPVVYLMDSQWDFPLAKSIYGQQYFDGFIPELIIVGVTWGGANPNADSLRARDYIPTGNKKILQGANQFLLFMKTELFPFIEKNYAADPNNRTLMGCSLGGLITLYALFTHGEMFNGYIAASPAIGWNNEAIYTFEKEYFEAESRKPVRLYMTIGDVENNVPGFERLSDFLYKRNYQSLQLKTKVLENTGHSGTKSETYTRGLQYVFERPVINISESALQKYVGKYGTTTGNMLEVKIESGKLVAYFSPTRKYFLKAASTSHFYSMAEFLNVIFEINNENITGLTMERYGSSKWLAKIN